MPASRRRRVDHAVMSRPPRRIWPSAAGRRPMTASISSVWPLPRTPATPTTSPRRTWNDRSRRSQRSSTDCTPSPTTSSSTTSVTVDSAVSGRGSSLPTIRSRELAGRRCLGFHRGDGAALAQDGDGVGVAEHLVELVGDEDDRLALSLEVAQVAEQLVHLVRHEHRRRFVEDEDLGASEEDLEDLDPLALTELEALHQLVRMDPQPIPLTQLDDPAAGGLEVDHRPPGRLTAEDDVLEHGEVAGQHEVLVDHADARGDGVLR